MKYSNMGFDSELFVLTHTNLHFDDSMSAHSCTCSKGRRAHATFSNHRQSSTCFHRPHNCCIFPETIKKSWAPIMVTENISW